jgi:Tol biopolymer transport system component
MKAFRFVPLIASPSIVLAALLLGFPSQALSQQTPTIIQLTHSSSGDCYPPVISADGSTIAFTSTADLTGQNPDGGHEVFVIKPDGTGLRQLTNTAAPPESIWWPSITADGSIVAFLSIYDLSGADPDLAGDIFLVNSDGTGLRQPMMMDATRGVINANGTVLVFDLGAIFIANVDGTNIRQLTYSTGGLTIEPSVSADGSIITFASNADLLGRPLGGDRDIFVINSDGTGLRQLTAAVGGSNSSNPHISGDGAIITFHSYSDLTGDNPAGTPEVFVVRPDGTGLRRLTDSPGGGSASSSISTDGSLIAFQGNGDPAGENAEGNQEEFTVKSDGTGLHQITHAATGNSDDPSITADGSMMVFRSSADLVGQNPDGNFELFLAMLPNTLPGSDVVVSLNGGLGVVGGIEVTFSEVTAAGNTTVATTSGGPPPPTGLKIVGTGGQPVYYDFNTTASFSGPVTVCIRYDESQVAGPEANLKLMQRDGGFVNITTSVDTANNIVCGTTAHMSIFIVAEAYAAVGGMVEMQVGGSDSAVDSAAGSSGDSSGRGYIVLAALAAAGLVALSAGGWYARRRWVR